MLIAFVPDGPVAIAGAGECDGCKADARDADVDVIDHDISVVVRRCVSECDAEALSGIGCQADAALSPILFAVVAYGLQRSPCGAVGAYHNLVYLSASRFGIDEVIP